ncbi:hypothetical protein ACIRVF_11165 [Kitasatospora sp. NPDC101157]|uniref:hypothetical protein n=1 Tax=Kitasatospora sp. NPDC101157 TaxID=3364098 RepID=UPI0037FA6089
MKRIQFGDVPLAECSYFTVQTFGSAFIGIDLVEDSPYGLNRVPANISIEEARKLRRALKNAIKVLEGRA